MPKKKYNVVPSKKQMSIIKKYWGVLQSAEDLLFSIINHIEKNMALDTGIDGIMFFRPHKCMWCKKDIFEDGEFVGVGTEDRSMRLLQAEDLEDKNG